MKSLNWKCHKCHTKYSIQYDDTSNEKAVKKEATKILAGIGISTCRANGCFSMQKYDGRMDLECIPLCDALNSLPGISTFESCCGHGELPFRIWFHADTLEALIIPTISFNKFYGNKVGWRIEVCHSEHPLKVNFMVEGPVGDYDHTDIIETINSFRLGGIK